MKYISLILLMIVSTVQAEITNGAVVIDPSKPAIVGLTTSGVVNRDRRTDASSTLLLGIVEDDSVTIIEQAPEAIEVEEFGLGEGLVVDDPNYTKTIDTK